ncbi:MAG: inositol monophosphatase [Clostridia bacterium]|nr:inositol monophosphatase [Clostridia bacterium]
MDYEGRLNAAMEAARQSGAMLVRREGFHTDRKAAKDFVTDMDRASERIIIDKLNALYPEDGFFGEEGGLRREADGMWVIDPIDGTTDYVKNQPLYTISIAYLYKGEVMVGVVYAPALDEMYTAISGRGAFMNGKPISVSSESDPYAAVASVSFVHNVPDVAKIVLPQLTALVFQVNDFRRTGSAAFDLCGVASGRFEAFLEPCLHLYDIAAGVLIVREAGGVVTGWDEGDDPLVSGNVLATNSLMHGFFAERLTLKGPAC